MPASRVRADYQELGVIANNFNQQAELARRMLQNIRQQHDVLQGGDWVGQGATMFYNEMGSSVLPTLNRLVKALEAANQTTRQIVQLMKEAEDAAARVLHADGGAAGTGTGGAGTGAGSGAGGGASGGAGRGGAAGSGASGGVAGGRVGARDKSIFERALTPMNPLDMLKQIDDLRQAIKTPTTLLSLARNANQLLQFAGFKGSELLGSPLLRSVSRGFTYYDIGKNSISLIKNIRDGNLDAIQNGADIFASGMGLIRNPYTMAFSFGYKAGQLIDKYTGVSSYLADKLVDAFGPQQTYSTRALVQAYVNANGSAADKAAFGAWRQEYNAQVTAAQQAGRPPPPFQPPDLPGLKGLDPAIVQMAQTNKDIPAVIYNMAVKNVQIPQIVRNMVFK